MQPPNTELERADPAKARRCYFGTLDLEVGGVALSGMYCFEPHLTSVSQSKCLHFQAVRAESIC